MDINDSPFRVLDQGHCAVLARIIQQHGSAPRSVGAACLLLGDGRSLDTVGGGTLEYQVMQIARNRQSGIPGRLVTLVTPGTPADALGQRKVIDDSGHSTGELSTPGQIVDISSCASPRLMPEAQSAMSGLFVEPFGSLNQVKESARRFCHPVGQLSDPCPTQFCGCLCRLPGPVSVCHRDIGRGL